MGSVASPLVALGTGWASAPPLLAHQMLPEYQANCRLIRRNAVEIRSEVQLNSAEFVHFPDKREHGLRLRSWSGRFEKACGHQIERPAPCTPPHMDRRAAPAFGNGPYAQTLLETEL